MRDIIERLREGLETCRHHDLCRVHEAESGCECAEAFDEIERLRANADSLWQDVQRADEANKQMAAEIERLRDDLRMLLLCESDRKQMAAEIERMKEEMRKWQSIGQEVTARYGEEIERLRTALTEIRDWTDYGGSYGLEQCREIASRALEGK